MRGRGEFLFFVPPISLFYLDIKHAATNNKDKSLLQKTLQIWEEGKRREQPELTSVVTFLN